MAQNVFSVVFGSFPAKYSEYLRDGRPAEGMFVTITECGRFLLQDSRDLECVFVLIVALHLWLQENSS